MNNQYKLCFYCDILFHEALIIGPKWNKVKTWSVCVGLLLYRRWIGSTLYPMSNDEGCRIGQLTY